MQVIEELDNAKKGTSEVSRNARQASRFRRTDRGRRGAEQIESGIPLSHPQGLQLARRGHRPAVFPDSRGRAWRSFGKVMPDNKILAAVLALDEATRKTRWCWCPRTSTCGSRPSISGLIAEDYENDRALDDFSLLYTGAVELPEDFWAAPQPGPAQLE